MAHEANPCVFSWVIARLINLLGCIVCSECAHAKLFKIPRPWRQIQLKSCRAWDRRGVKGLLLAALLLFVTGQHAPAGPAGD